MKEKAYPTLAGILLGMLIIGTFVLADLDSKSTNIAKATTSLASSSIDLPLNIQLGLDYKFNSQVDYQFSILQDFANSKPGTYSIYIKDLKTGVEKTLNKDTNYYSASLYKVPVAIAVLRDVEANKISLENELTLTLFDKESGSGSLQGYKTGSKLTVKQTLEKLLKESDNTAQNMLTRSISMPVGNYFPYASVTRFPNTLNITPSEMIELLEKLATYSYLAAENSNLIINMLSQTSFDDRINVGLGEDVTFSHKIGNWGNEGSWHDCGIVLNEKIVLVCVMSSGTTYEDFVEVSEETGKFIKAFML
ncbi:MAG: serine hydrolase [Patescibacteria group bacterium]